MLSRSSMAGAMRPNWAARTQWSQMRALSTTSRLQRPGPIPEDAKDLNKVSRNITKPKAQGASQAMLYATGMEHSDLDKAQVGISSVWYSGNPCNMHLMGLNNKVKEGVERAGLHGMQFNTIGVSDGISMGTKGMRYSLQSRDLIADSIETVMGGQWYDANISIPGCDKNMPGVIMAMGRVNRPSLMVYGGTIAAGCGQKPKNNKLDIVSAFQAYGQFISGEITEEERFDVIRHSCPGSGACGGMYTANTLASVIEVMGMSLPGSSSNPAESKAKMMECLAAGGAIKNLLKEDIRPSDIITRTALENAMILVNITGGSTNAVLHLIAIAHSVGITLTIDDFQAVSDRTPFLADLKPSGKYVFEDLYNIGGTPSLIKYLLKEGVLDGSGMTVTGKTLKQNAELVPDFPADQDIIRPLSNPIKPTATSRSSAAASPPKAPSARSPAKKAPSSPARPAALTPKTSSSRPSKPALSRRARRPSSSSATRAPRVAPVCPRCSSPAPPSWATVSATTSPSSPTVASPVAATVS